VAQDMLFVIGFGCGTAMTLLVLVAASYLWPDPERPPAQPIDRDPRAPEGMSDIQYRGWKQRRDIADEFIRRMDAK
jgi:hypothetical protein